MVVGTECGTWTWLEQPRSECGALLGQVDCLESLQVASTRDRRALSRTAGRLLMLRFGATGGELVCGQAALPGAVHALCTAT